MPHMTGRGDSCGELGDFEVCDDRREQRREYQQRDLEDEDSGRHGEQHPVGVAEY